LVIGVVAASVGQVERTPAVVVFGDIGPERPEMSESWREFGG